MRKNKYEVFKVIGREMFSQGVFITKKFARRKKKDLKSEYPWKVQILKIKS